MTVPSDGSPSGGRLWVGVKGQRGRVGRISGQVARSIVGHSYGLVSAEAVEVAPHSIGACEGLVTAAEVPGEQNWVQR